jgi:hypothetical protein
VTCEIDTKGWIARTKFTKIDGTESLSHSEDVSALTLTDKVITLNPGERITETKVFTETAKFLL